MLLRRVFVDADDEDDPLPGEWATTDDGGGVEKD